MSRSDLCVEWTRDLIRIPSLPGQESELADRVMDRLRQSGLDEVWRDDVGNVLALYRGRGESAPLILNTHLDHVDPGDPGRWPHPPFSGDLADGRIWGRGAVDIKGPLAAQMTALVSLAEEGRRPPGDIHLTAVVQEEVGGLGARHLASSLEAPYVIIGEPSRNQLKRGHRGRVQFSVRFEGSSVHASIPEAGINPLESLARFIAGLEKVEHADDEELGLSTLAPTLVSTDQRSPNVTPGQVEMTIDWRTVPAEDVDDIRQRLQGLAEECAVGGASAIVEIAEKELVSYTGKRIEMQLSHPAFLRPSGDPAVEAAARVLENSSGDPHHAGIWRFATDGGHFAEKGKTVIGFGPGDDRLAHTWRESIGVSELTRGVEAYRSLILEWTRSIEGGEKK